MKTVMGLRWMRHMPMLLAWLLGWSFASTWAAGEPQMVKEALAPAAQADRIVLRVQAQGGKEKSWTLGQLEALGMHRVKTTTYWPDDNGAYEGPLLNDVLRASGLNLKTEIRVLARDGFSQLLPEADLSSWPLLLATRREGRPLDVARKGPLRIIYPRDMDKRLEAPVYRMRWVWMVERIEPAY